MSNEHLLIRGDGLDEARAQIRANLARLDAELEGKDCGARGDATTQYKGYEIIESHQKQGKPTVYVYKGTNMKWKGDSLDKAKQAVDQMVARGDADEDARGDAWDYGTRVRIKGGMKEFHGKTGTIQLKEGKAWRVKLDEPVEIPGVGKVKDDLWESSHLTKIG